MGRVQVSGQLDWGRAIWACKDRDELRQLYQVAESAGVLELRLPGDGQMLSSWFWEARSALLERAGASTVKRAKA